MEIKNTIAIGLPSALIPGVSYSKKKTNNISKMKRVTSDKSVLEYNRFVKIDTQTDFVHDVDSGVQKNTCQVTPAGILEDHPYSYDFLSISS